MPPTRFQDLFRLDDAGDDVFVATLDGWEGFTFGGHTFGLATLAASRTCPDRQAHSLHIHYLRRVPADQPVRFRVSRLRDGRRIAHRRVDVEHDGKLHATVMASFARPGPGARFQYVDTPRLPAPGELTPEEEVAKQEKWDEYEPDCLEWRWPGRPWGDRAEGEGVEYEAWVRPRESLGGDDGLTAAALAYASDYHSHWAVERELGFGADPRGYASLDIGVWIHGEIRWDDWRAFVSGADIGRDGRAFTRRQMHTRDGRLAMSVTQEMMIPDHDR